MKFCVKYSLAVFINFCSSFNILPADENKIDAYLGTNCLHMYSIYIFSLEIKFDVNIGRNKAYIFLSIQ